MTEHPVFVRNAAMPEPWRTHFPKTETEAAAWMPLVLKHALHHKVLTVARTRIEGAWCAYVAAVPGLQHEQEIEGVLHDGAKLDELVARVIFPEFEAVPYAR